MDVLTDSFFQKGAFLTDYETGDILLGEGGEVSQATEFGSPGAFYLKDFFEDHYLIYRPEKWHRLTRSELLKSLGSDTFTVTKSQHRDDIYARDFENLKQVFNQGLQKVVLISREEFNVDDSMKARRSLFHSALTFGVGLPYGIWCQDYGVVGSTPELLYSSNKGELYTFALAGTRKAGQEQELLNSAKDRLEHDLVVTDIKEKLSPFCTEVESLQTGLTSYKDIIHLKTDIKAMLNPDVNFQKLTSRLSPTAALGGYPKEASLKFLKQTEYFKTYPERYFGSAFGLITQDLNQFVVSIRNIQWKGDQFFIESGGGVLPASQLEKELEEICLKRDTIKKHYL